MIEYNIICKSNHWPVRLKRVKLIVSKILSFKRELKFNFNIDYNCNIILADNKLIKKINTKFRKKNSATDILTFVYPVTTSKKNKTKLSDIFLSAEIIKKDAKLNKVNFYDHLCHLLVHGFLHLNGFNHKNLKDFNKMKNIEIKILRKLNIENPYIYI